RAVHEQVAAKLTARFVDIGARQVKNIPTPVHAYLVATWEHGHPDVPPAPTAPASAKASTRRLPVALGALALCTAAFVFLPATPPSMPPPEGKVASIPAATEVLLRDATAALPPPIAKAPVAPAPVPAIRRASAAPGEAAPAKRTLQFCNDL